ncbi:MULTISPECIES: universal stress protein [unclassified Pseudactinotalea]|uniref:universal stress protein n=1 Tax=unclassified Pseudactinotalea TaxID=2649176 RepID=UPI00128CDE19|nr:MULTISPECIES: universal stress protein [unclassified Pseudactinotalea]MPV49432.1 universal stress protein [Pseudactinotalea sp. HY160]QGH69278.1 universal stress protein [Pseudactinotalea sp. HY158]
MAVVVGFLANNEGRAALRGGIAEAGLRGEDLVVLVYPIQGPEPVDVSATAAEARATLADAGVSGDIREPVRSEDLAEELLRVAETSDANLIVIGLRRRSPTGKLILGSNAQRILLDSPTPVLAVKP